MLVSILSVIALASAPMAVSAAGTLGMCLGNVKPDGSCKVQSDYEMDFDALGGVTKLVRTYNSGGTCNTASEILGAAANKGFKVVLGVWPDTDDAYNADKSALKSVMSDSTKAAAIYAITVGSEALYRKSVNQGGMSAQDLLAKISDMKNTFPNVKVGTVDSWNVFQDGTADSIVQSGLKFIMVNAFSYWQGQEPRNASHSYIDDLFQAIGHIQNVAGSTDIEIWNGETGWPSDGGSSYQSAQAGTNNANSFFKGGVCAALNWGFNVFYFEAFDEPNKGVATGKDGSTKDERHWGAFNSDRSSKLSLSC